MPDPVAIRLGPLAVHWYGLMYLVAFAQVVLLGIVRIKTQPHIQKEGWVKKDLDDLVFYGAMGAIIGGRLGEVLFYNFSYFLAHPLQIFAVWNGGMSYHGGFIGVLIGMYLFARKKGRHFVQVFDFIGPLTPLGYACGRLGNFINAELPGRVADASLPWAMIWPNVDALPRHPSPLYQALASVVIVFIPLWIVSMKPHKMGTVSAVYLILHGFARFFTEYFRVPDYSVGLGPISISAGQMLSIPMVVIGFIWLYGLYGRKKDTA